MRDGGPWPWDVYEQELHLPGVNVQYPLRDKWGLVWQKSILSATTSKTKKGVVRFSSDEQSLELRKVYPVDDEAAPMYTIFSAGIPEKG